MNPTVFEMDSVSEAGEYDALADLFLADNQPSPAARTPGPACTAPSTEASGRPAMAPPLIEGVIVGHLPVLASAWVTQYARFVADAEREPLALLKLQAGQVSIDVVMPGGEKLSPNLVAAPGEAMDAAVTRAAAAFRRWIVRVDEPSEADLLNTPGLTSVAMLTAANDSAIFSSYQLIKSFAEVSKDSAHQPDFRLVIMGSADDKAAEAETKLRRAVTMFLARPVAPAARIPRIGNAASISIFRGPATGDIRALLETIRHAKPTSPTAAKIAPVNHPQPAPAPIARPSPAPQQQKTRVLSDQASSMTPRLPDLTVLSASCPYAPAVELAIGADGSLHLVAGCTESLQVGEAAKRLLTAASWAHDHAPLLATAFPALKSKDAVLHVITADARQARGLLDTGLRVHLAASVEVEGKTAWTVSDLN